MTDNSVKPTGESATSTGLLQAALANDAVAWQRLVRLYGPLLYTWCRKWGLQPCDADNVGQDTFLKVSRNLRSFRSDRSGDTFRGWLYRIARNCFVDFTREQQTTRAASSGRFEDRPLEDLTQPVGAAPPREAPEEARLLHRSAMELIRSEYSERDWQAFCKLVINGRPPRDVAAELAVPVNVVYLAKSRILRRLKVEFAGLLPDGR